MAENSTIFTTCYTGTRFTSKNGQIYLRACYWYKRLFAKSLAMFELKNAPETINATAMEYRLMTQGSVIIDYFNNETYGSGLYALSGAYYDPDPYGFPRKTTIYNMRLGQKIGDVGKTSVVIRSNKMVMPVIPHINQYAETMAQIDIGISVNLSNINSTRVFSADNDKQAQAIRKMMDSATSGEPAVNIKKTHLGESKNDQWIFNEGVNYLVHNYIQDKIGVLSEFDSIFGVEYLPIEKGGNMLNAEVVSSARDLEINKQFWLEARNEDLSVVNKIYGTNMYYDLRDPDKKYIEFMTGNNSAPPENNAAAPAENKYETGVIDVENK